MVSCAADVRPHLNQGRLSIFDVVCELILKAVDLPHGMRHLLRNTGADRGWRQPTRSHDPDRQTVDDDSGSNRRPMALLLRSLSARTPLHARPWPAVPSEALGWPACGDRSSETPLRHLLFLPPRCRRHDDPGHGGAANHLRRGVPATQIGVFRSPSAARNRTAW